MTKNEVITIINSDLSEPAKFGALTQALSKAPVKNLSMANFYNRSGYSKARLKTLEYDVQKAFSISKADLSSVEKVTSSKLESSDSGKQNQDFDIETALDVDFSKLNYHKELRPLASDVAEFLGEELESQKKADLIAYLEEKKSSIQPEQDEEE